MKKILSLLLIPFITLALSSCFKEDHKVRLRNDFHEALNNVTAGTASLGNVAARQTSGYSAIKTGNFTISGRSTSGLILSGSGSITGKGSHKWTITVSSTGPGYCRGQVTNCRTCISTDCTIAFF